MTTHAPVLFVGHGNPMNAISDNPYKATWQKLGQQLPKPRAILCVSAHWQTALPSVCTANPPPTIHDFGGFPAELFAQQYPAPAAPELVSELQSLLGSTLLLSNDWGLDHGAWCILMHLFPQANVPVCQLSLARQLSAQQHADLAKKLLSLREQNVMVICSGNIVHNLAKLSQGTPPPWAVEFDQYITRALNNHDMHALVNYSAAGSCGQLAVPTDEHYLPLLYAAGMRTANDTLSYFNTDFDLGSLSMRSFILDATQHAL